MAQRAAAWTRASGYHRRVALQSGPWRRSHSRQAARDAGAAGAAAPPNVPATDGRNGSGLLSRPGAIPPTLVRAVVWSHAPEVQSCYDRATMEHPDLHGRMLIRATIAATGRVLSLSPTSNIDNAARLQACVVSAFKSWPFPAPAGAATAEITYAFSFE